jgi:hypothetical protein
MPAEARLGDGVRLLEGHGQNLLIFIFKRKRIPPQGVKPRQTTPALELWTLGPSVCSSRKEGLKTA